MQQILCRWSFHLLQLNGKTIEPRGSHMRYLMAVYFQSDVILVFPTISPKRLHEFLIFSISRHFMISFKKIIEQEINEI